MGSNAENADDSDAGFKDENPKVGLAAAGGPDDEEGAGAGAVAEAEAAGPDDEEGAGRGGIRFKLTELASLFNLMLVGSTSVTMENVGFPCGSFSSCWTNRMGQDCPKICCCCLA
jgi:hypothetical protein